MAPVGVCRYHYATTTSELGSFCCECYKLLWQCTSDFPLSERTPCTVVTLDVRELCSTVPFYATSPCENHGSSSNTPQCQHSFPKCWNRKFAFSLGSSPRICGFLCYQVMWWGTPSCAYPEHMPDLWHTTSVSGLYQWVDLNEKVIRPGRRTELVTQRKDRNWKNAPCERRI